MSGKTAAIIGATGMIGTYLTEQILKDDYFSTVRVIVRRPIQKTSPKMEVKLVDFDDAESVKLALEETDAVFCCIGTTQKNVKGDKELYRKVDLDIPVKTARFAKEAGCEKYIIITAIGANSKSNNFYLRLKGQVEDALEGIGLRSVHIFQPSMLLGNRKENRPVEKIMNPIMKVVSGLLVFSLRKYKS
ncbi:MAG: NAD(P)H-binding protein, partial [Chitinophagaceae bacterium]